MMQDLDRQQIEEYESVNHAQTDRSRRRSRKRKKKSRGIVRMLLILVFCAMLGGVSWMTFRLVRSASGNNEEIVTESSRPVVPQTIPESGAETF